MSYPLVSIIITSKNEAVNIFQCLNSIQNQIYTHTEVLLIDNQSLDKTVEIAREFTSKIYQKGPERSTQRNFGASKAHGEYLFFVDADMQLSKSVVGDCVAAIKNKKAIIIPEESFGKGFWAKCKALERSYYVGVPWIEAARFIDTDAFWHIHGYDEELTGPEDFDIQQRIKDTYGEHSIGRIRSYIYHNEGSLSITTTLRKKFYYSKTIDRYKKKIVNKEYYKNQASIFKRYLLFLSKPSIFLEHPILWIGMVAMKTMEFAAGGIGYISKKFIKL